MEAHKVQFIRNLKKYMELNDYNQNELANKMGVTKSVISSWITGKRFPKMASIQKLADIFGIEKSNLIESNHAPIDPDLKDILQNAEVMFDGLKYPLTDDKKSLLAQVIKSVLKDDGK